MREQRQESERILSCQRSLTLNWGCTKDLCCHLFAVVIDVVTEFGRERVLCELLYADDSVWTSDVNKGMLLVKYFHKFSFMCQSNLMEIIRLIQC